MAADGPDARVQVGRCTLRLIGTVAGADADGPRVAAAIRSHDPAAVALGIPPDDLDPLVAACTGAYDPGDVAELDGMDAVFVDLLRGVEGGAVTIIPSPDLAAAHASGLPLVAIDLDDDTHSQRYTETVRVRHLVQRSSVQKRIARLEATHFADRFVLAARWDALFGRVKPLAGLEREREAHMAKRLRALTTEHERIVAVVPAPRFAGVVSRVATDGA